MIKIYKKEDFKEEFINIINEDTNHWDYPISELDYLLENSKNESYLLLEDRLHELTGWVLDYFIKEMD